jgi:hypothetical protein
MEVNIVVKSLMITFHTMGFVERIQFQEHHKKIVCQKDEQDNHVECKSMRLHAGLPLQF